MLTITQIEDAIIARLKDQITYLRTCGSLADFQATDLTDITQLTLNFPAAWVVYAGGEFENLAGNAQDRRMVFTVLVAAKSARGGDAPRHGEASEKGVYDMLEDIRAALTNQTVGLSISGLLPVDEEAVEGTKDLAIFAIRFWTRCENT